MLYDQAAEVVSAYGLLNQSAGYANPNVLIVDKEGAVVWRHKGSVSHRTPNRDILAQLEKLS